MAALQLHEDKSTGRLILQPSLASRLSGCAFGLVALVGAGVLLISMIEASRVDWIAVIAFLIFAFLPMSASFFNAIFTMTVTIDRTARTVSAIRLLFFFPVDTRICAFNDLTKIEVQYVPNSSAANVWLVNAVTRDNKRVRLNWNGAQREITDLAEKVSALIGVPVVQAEFTLPTVLRDVLKKVAPEAADQTKPTTDAPAPSPGAPTLVLGRLLRDILDQAASNEAAPPRPDPYAPPPVAEPWLMSPRESAQTEESAAPIAETAASAPSVWDLPVSALEQRVARDSLDADARYALARRCHSRGDLARAIDLYRQVVRIDATNPNAQNDLGVALQARGKRAEAEVAYRRAVALDPFSTTAHLNLALLLRDAKRATEASQEFFLARQNARKVEERNAAEAASSGAKMDPQLSKT
jgi:hypothetical protein